MDAGPRELYHQSKKSFFYQCDLAIFISLCTGQK
jgi:hypothetical protein